LKGRSLKRNHFSFYTGLIILTGFLILSANLPCLYAQSEQIAGKDSVHWLGFNEGLDKAKKENKPILIDFYTDWCTWCKEMEKQVFGHKEVAKYINDNFIAVKCNAESQQRVLYKDRHYTQRELSFAMSVTSYPTTLFMTHEAAPITRLPGYVPAEVYLDVIEYINLGAYDKMNFEEWQKKKLKRK